MIMSFVSMLMKVIKPPFNFIYAFCHGMLFDDFVDTFILSHFITSISNFEGGSGTKCAVVLNKSQFNLIRKTSTTFNILLVQKEAFDIGYSSVIRSIAVALNNIFHFIIWPYITIQTRCY